MSDSDTTTPARRTYRFPPHGSGGWILGMTIPQLCAVTAAGFAAVDALRTLPAPAGPVLAAALAIVAYLAIFLPYAGHTTLEWVPVIARFMFATATSTRTWRTRAATMGHEVELSAGDGTARFEPRPVRAPVSLPPELKRVEILEARLGRSVPLGVVHDKAAGTYAATIRCEPRAFALLGEENRETLLSGYGGLLASFAQDSSPVRRIAWYERTLPASAGELQAYAREHVRP
ncbi:MAG: SCO6880 family protein, partial [Solirubrobacteraceae bacterium]